MIKHLLLSALLVGLAFAAHAQTWVNPLPLDSTTGYIVYRGRFDAPNQNQAQTSARAARFARTELTGTPSATIDTSRAGKMLVSGGGSRRFNWRGSGIVGNTGRTLHYELTLRPRNGYYEYEVSNFTNETPVVQYAIRPGLDTKVESRTAAVETVLRNPDSYDKKHRPQPGFRSYCEAINAAVQATLTDTKAALGVR